MSPTLRLTCMAMFVALSLAIQMIPVPPVSGGLLRFAALPIILSGFVLGPRAGFMVGVTSDVLECLLIPRGMFFPGFTLTQGLTGALPALVAGPGPASFRRYLVGIAVSQSLTKFLLVPVFLLVLAPVPDPVTAWKVLAVRALITQSAHIPLYAWVCLVVVRALEAARTAVRQSAGFLGP